MGRHITTMISRDSIATEGKSAAQFFDRISHFLVGDGRQLRMNVIHVPVGAAAPGKQPFDRDALSPASLDLTVRDSHALGFEKFAALFGHLGNHLIRLHMPQSSKPGSLLLLKMPSTLEKGAHGLSPNP
jgi:hypothetical protein